MSTRHPTEPEGLAGRAGRLRAEALTRAAAAGHAPEKLRTFDEALAGLDGDALWEAVTLRPAAAAALDVQARLDAEADPLSAWTANRAHGAVDALGLPARGSVRPRVVVGTEEDREVSLTGARRLQGRDLGESPASPSGRHVRPFAESLAEAPTGPSGRYARPRAGLDAPPAPSARHQGPTAGGLLGIRHRRVAAGPEWPTARLVSLLVEALARGPVVAQVSGPTASCRGIFLQARAAGKGHALQLHVPSTGETAWFNAQDLLDGASLPVAGWRVCAVVELLVPGGKEEP